MFEFGEVGIGILGALGTFLSGFFSWFFTRRSYQADVKGKEVANFDSSIDAYRKMYEDMLDDLRNQNSELKEQNAELKREIDQLKKEQNESRNQIITLTNFVLATALKRSEEIKPATVDTLKKILDQDGYKEESNQEA